MSGVEVEAVRYKRILTVGGGVQAICNHADTNACRCSIVCRFIAQRGFFAATEATLFEHIWSTTPPGERVLVDVGANVGFYTTLSSAWGATVTAFEPQHQPRRLLQLSVDANGAAAAVKVLPYGAGAAEAYASVGAPGDWELGVLRLSTAAPGADGGLRIVPLSRHVPPGRITILKVDTEGFELSVFDGAWGVLPRVGYVIVEVKEYNSAEKRALLRKIRDVGGFSHVYNYKIDYEATEYPTTGNVAVDAGPVLDGSSSGGDGAFQFEDFVFSRTPIDWTLPIDKALLPRADVQPST